MNNTAKGYIGIVGIAGLAGLFYGWVNLGHINNYAILALLVALCAAAQATAVPLFSDSSVSISFAVSFISLLIFGPAGGILANLGAAAMHAIFPVRRPWYKVVFNTGVLIVSMAAAGMIYQAAGGDWPPRSIGSAMMPVVAASVVCFLVQTGLISGVVSLTTSTNVLKVFKENHYWLILHYLMAAAISLMAALGFQSMGWLGLLAFSLPLTMPWLYTKMYVAQTKTVIARNADLVALNARLEEANVSLERRIQEMGTFYQVGMVLNKLVDLQDILGYIVNSVRELTQAHGVAIFVYDQERKALTLGSQVGLSDAYVRQPEMSMDGPALRALSERRRITLDGRLAAQDFLSAVAVQEGIVAAACLPLAIGNEVVGALDITFREPHDFSEGEIRVMETFAEQVAAAIHSARLYQQVHSSYLSTIAVLVATVEAKDPYTHGHSERVRDYAVRAGIQMGLSEEELHTLDLSALFHDIGKIGIPDGILTKASALTDDEWLQIKRHPEVAVHILANVPTLAETMPIIRSHHERPDGKGYPDGIKDIPKLSAIIAVADAYDAMCTDRPYREAMGKEYAISELQKGIGKQFDGGAVAAFLKAIEPQSERRPDERPQILVPGIRFRLAGGAPLAGTIEAMSRSELA